MHQRSIDVCMMGTPGRSNKVASGHTAGTVGGQALVHEGLEPRAPSQGAIMPRLLDLETAAAYLSMSPWTIRDLEAAGVLPRVRVPLPDGRDLRKLLFDKADLDRLIAAWKDTAA